jgi:hypothetical protein
MPYIFVNSTCANPISCDLRIVPSFLRSTYFGETHYVLWGDLSRTLGRPITYFGETYHVLWGDQARTLGRPITYFGETKREKIMQEPILLQ